MQYWLRGSHNQSAVQGAVPKGEHQVLRARDVPAFAKSQLVAAENARTKRERSKAKLIGPGDIQEGYKGLSAELTKRVGVGYKQVIPTGQPEWYFAGNRIDYLKYARFTLRKDASYCGTSLI